MTLAALSVNGLTIRDRQGGAIVADISFTIPAGSALTVIGETGSGKSLIAQALFGLLPETMRACGRISIAGAPAIDVLALVQGHVDARDSFAARANAGQPGGNDAGVVDNDHVARPQQAGQIADALILQQRNALRIDVEQARALSRLCRAQRNPLFGEFKIENIDAHGVSVRRRRPDRPTRADVRRSAQFG